MATPSRRGLFCTLTVLLLASCMFAATPYSPLHAEPSPQKKKAARKKVTKKAVKKAAKKRVSGLGKKGSSGSVSVRIKSNDTILLDAGARGKLAWFSGNWTVLDAGAVANKHKWRVENLTEANGKTTFRLRNLHSNSFLDGDNDNSVVLDGSDHTWWQVTGSLTNNKAATIFNKDFGGVYCLWDRGDNDGDRDVVLRKSTAHSTPLTVKRIP